MAYALTTQGQGSTAFINIGTLVPNAGSGTGLTWFEWDIAYDDVNAYNQVYLLGSNSNDTGLHYDIATGLFYFWRSTTTEHWADTPVSWSAGTRAVIRFELDDVASGADSTVRVYFNGQQVLTFVVVGGTVPTAMGIGIRQYRYSPITLYRFVVGGSHYNPLATYSDGWVGDEISGSGTTWPSVGGSRNLTLTNKTLGDTDSQWLFYNSPAEPTVGYVLSTKNQGSSCYLQTLTTTGNTGAAWVLGGRFIVHDLSVNAQLLGALSNTQTSLRVLTDGTLVMRSSASNRIWTAPGAVQVDVPFDWEIRNNVATGEWELYFNDMVTPVGTYARGSSIWSINQLGAFNTTVCSPITVERFYVDNATDVDGRYEWDFTSGTGTGVYHYSKDGSRVLQVINAAGEPDSWWINYGGAINQLSATLSSASSLSAGLTAVNRMAVSLQSISALNANLTVGTPVTNLAATLSSASALAATLTVANRMSASLASSSAVSATLTAKHKLSASLQSVSSISASLTLTSGSVVFPIDVAGIPDGTYPVALFNHETGDFVSRTNVTFVSGSAEVASALPVGTEFSGYVIETGVTPTVGAVVYGQVAYAS